MEMDINLDIYLAIFILPWCRERWRWRRRWWWSWGGGRCGSWCWWWGGCFHTGRWGGGLGLGVPVLKKGPRSGLGVQCTRARCQNGPSLLCPWKVRNWTSRGWAVFLVAPIFLLAPPIEHFDVRFDQMSVLKSNHIVCVFLTRKFASFCRSFPNARQYTNKIAFPLMEKNLQTYKQVWGRLHPDRLLHSSWQCVLQTYTYTFPWTAS